MKDIIIITTVGAMILGFAIFGVSMLGKVDCDKLQSMSGKDTKYSLIGGCYVEVNGKFIPRDNWRGEYEK